MHTVPGGCFPSVGQCALVPVQNSAASHSSTAGRHVVVAGLKVSAGQSSLEPSQVSATSQGPAAARHSVPAGCFASSGQAVLVPSQVSATSQAPATARHSAPALPAGCWQVSWVPSHSSSVQGFVSAVHAVPLVFFWSLGHAWPATPLHVSARSHSPAAADRKGAVGGRRSGGGLLLVPAQVWAGLVTA